MTMWTVRTLLLTMLIGGALLRAGVSSAQQAPRVRDRAQEGPRAQEVRRRLAQIVQNQLGLTNAEMTQLEEVNRRFEGERMQLVQQERQIRLSLRQQMAASTRDERSIDAGLKELFGIQRKRLDILEREQRDLSAFLTPSQRVKYLVLQDAVQKRVNQMRRGEAGRARRQEPLRFPLR
jgi:Spy/CpxP family protein refolding chaperone